MIYKVFHNADEVAEFETFKEVLEYIASQVSDRDGYIDIENYTIYKKLK